MPTVTCDGRNFDKMRVDENNHVIWRDIGLFLLSNPSNNLNVGKINCPVLLVNGCDDQNWPSVESAEDVNCSADACCRQGAPPDQTGLPNAGHLIEPPYSPHFRATNFIELRTKKKVVMLWGGQTKPHSDAQEDSWRKILSFLHLHIQASRRRQRWNSSTAWMGLRTDSCSSDRTSTTCWAW
ncbi:hypothetical protein INR49_004869 [Caranx melampygus]|nr:hypothetical protein INR49_004869 [Caranx melampygus]